MSSFPPNGGSDKFYREEKSTSSPEFYNSLRSLGREGAGSEGGEDEWDSQIREGERADIFKEAMLTFWEPETIVGYLFESAYWTEKGGWGEEGEVTKLLPYLCIPPLLWPTGSKAREVQVGALVRNAVIPGMHKYVLKWALNCLPPMQATMHPSDVCCLLSWRGSIGK